MVVNEPLNRDWPFATLQDAVRQAHARLPATTWAHLSGGAETESTLRRNRQALDALGLVPRVLQDMTDVDVSGRWMGHATALPVFLAGIGSLRRLHPEGVTAMALAAAQHGVAFGVSSSEPEELETVAAAAPDAVRYYQLYVDGDDTWLDEVLGRVVANGYTGLAVTVDSAVYGHREREIVLRGSDSRRRDATTRPHRAGLTWQRIEWLRARCNLPLILKGIGSPHDAQHACALGVDAVYLSNHGGRQLDHALGTAELLPEIVEVVGGRAEVLVDGGFYRGTDVLKALALGASAVGLGRLYAWGLAAAGAAGVARVLALLEREIHISLSLLGCRTFSDLTPDHVRRLAPLQGLPVGFGHVPSGWNSAFPLLADASRSGHGFPHFEL
ncbi:alpha-hydroxy-acid oxidizing protein [Lampropedia puyangensis]|uniref:Alpha-hydroxy-acid oxidizing protein n=1 Tax=Lampropedia puyangensis TaxID=1330072 RepID=A0A4S8EUB9_9BURK|nr:alpha-hydroxy acid oxidase [Lampropedia puyangensis]THT98096.1 alpha-hydroxy-acid oxidizing protein [Lampropedia puyangensis]